MRDDDFNIVDDYTFIPTLKGWIIALDDFGCCTTPFTLFSQVLCPFLSPLNVLWSLCTPLALAPYFHKINTPNIQFKAFETLKWINHINYSYLVFLGQN